MSHIMMIVIMMVDYGGGVHIPAVKRVRDVDLLDRRGLISPSGMSLTVRRREVCGTRTQIRSVSTIWELRERK